MRPERFVRATAVLRIKLRSLTAIFSVFLFVQFSPNLRANAAQAPPSASYDPASFSQELQRLKESLSNASYSGDALRAYREALPKSWPVDIGGRRFEVPTRPLASHLTRAERDLGDRGKELDQARAYLNSLAEETSSFSSAQQQPTTTQSIRSELDAILARPEYAHTKKRSWSEKFREQVNEFFLNLLARLFRGVGSPQTFGYVLLWLGVAGAAILIAYWVFRNWLRGARAAELALRASAVPARSWQEWVFASREAAARGDYRTAVHCAYWAGIARLQDLGALAPDRAKTPREYLGALTKGKGILAEDAATRRQALEQMTSRVEKTWYGYQPATELDFHDSLAELEILGCQLR